MDTRFEIQTLEVWGRARYFSVTEAPHNTELLYSSGLTPKLVQHLLAPIKKRVHNGAVKSRGQINYNLIKDVIGYRILLCTFIMFIKSNQIKSNLLPYYIRIGVRVYTLLVVHYYI